MKKVWITYAWKDNEDRDIDFVIQELDKTDLEIKFDRRNLIPGQRLWTKIGGFITDPHECDAWGIILTPNSLRSESCIEELSYALDRALSTNGEEFPLFALLHKISPKEIPPPLKIRLAIRLGDSDWVNQVLAAANKQPLGYKPSNLSEFLLKEYRTPEEYKTLFQNLPHIPKEFSDFCLEIKPRLERIAPFVVAVDLNEKISGNVIYCSVGCAGQIPTSWHLNNWFDKQAMLPDGTNIWLWMGDNEAGPTFSYYLHYKKRPKRIWCGRKNGLKLQQLDNLSVGP